MDRADNQPVRMQQLVIGQTTDATARGPLLTLFERSDLSTNHTRGLSTKRSIHQYLAFLPSWGQALRQAFPLRWPKYGRSLIRSKQQGFTLIEILVVMLIISITFGFAMLAFGDFGESRKIRTAAEAFAQFVELVHEEALLESSTLQIQLTHTGYSAQRMNAKHHWQPLHASHNHPPALPAKTKITVAYGSKKPDQLVIIMSGSGDMTPFKVYFGSAKQAHLATVSGNENGLIVFNDTDTR